jgi:hypothetical protein
VTEIVRSTPDVTAANVAVPTIGAADAASNGPASSGPPSSAPESVGATGSSWTVATALGAGHDNSLDVALESAIDASPASEGLASEEASA